MKPEKRSSRPEKRARKKAGIPLEESGPRAAFLPDPGNGPARTRDDLAEELAEEFVSTATSDADAPEELQDEVAPEEHGGPFVTTSAKEEYAQGTDASNPKDAEPEPLPRVLSES